MVGEFLKPTGVEDWMRIFLVSSGVFVWCLFAWTAIRTLAEAPRSRLTRGRAFRCCAIGIYSALCFDDLIWRTHQPLSWRSPLFALGLIFMVGAWGSTEKVIRPLVQERPKK